MKRKYIAMALGLMMSVSSLTATGAFAEENSAVEVSTEQTDADTSASVVDENATYGEVTAVEDGKITVDVGTLSEASENGEASIEKSGETLTVEITDETQIRQGGGMFGGGPGGAAPDPALPAGWLQPG